MSVKFSDPDEIIKRDVVELYEELAIRTNLRPDVRDYTYIQNIQFSILSGQRRPSWRSITTSMKNRDRSLTSRAWGLLSSPIRSIRRISALRNNARRSKYTYAYIPFRKEFFGKRLIFGRRRIRFRTGGKYCREKETPDARGEKGTTYKTNDTNV